MGSFVITAVGCLVSVYFLGYLACWSVVGMNKGLLMVVRANVFNIDG